LRIKILGKTDQIKGRAFERLMSILLDYMGYTDFRPGIHYTGMEVDLKGEAKHKVKQESILCECKAHERPIGSEPLTDFFGKLSIKRSKSPSLKGVFASSSGFTGTALEMIDNDLAPADRENLEIVK
jgi:restriction endonuclease Mrr